MSIWSLRDCIARTIGVFCAPIIVLSGETRNADVRIYQSKVNFSCIYPSHIMPVFEQEISFSIWKENAADRLYIENLQQVSKVYT